MELKTGERRCLCETAAAYGRSEDIGIHALAEAVNALKAAGADAYGVKIRIRYPGSADRPEVYRIEKKLRKICGQREIPVLGSGYVQIPFLPVPEIRVTGLGVSPGNSEDGGRENREQPGKICGGSGIRKACAGKEIVLAGWVGMDGMLRAVKERRDEFDRHFSQGFVRQILSYEPELFAEQVIGAVRDGGACCIRQIGEGGVFAALWDLAKESGTGLSADLKRIPILQETVEVCEYFRMNPYQLISAGSFLIVTDSGEELADTLRRQGREAAVIGALTDGQDKIIRNGEDVRYIDRPAPDEIYRIFER